MITKKNKNAMRKIRHRRVRKRLSGTPGCPRLCVYRSTSKIYAQVIDDVSQTTLVSASTMEADLRAATKDMTRTESAKLIGETIGKRASEMGIVKVVFDRGGYLYQGRVAALANGARSTGLKF